MIKLLFIWFMLSELKFVFYGSIPLVSNINYTISCDERYMKVSVDLNRKDFIFNVTFDVQTPVTAIIVTPSVSIPINDNDNSYARELFKGTINICELKNIFKTRLLLKLVMETFMNGLEEPLTCPIKKGPVKLLKCVLKKDSAPALLQTSKFKVTGNMMARLPNQKKLIKICTAEIFAKYNRPK